MRVFVCVCVYYNSGKLSHFVENTLLVGETNSLLWSQSHTSKHPHTHGDTNSILVIKIMFTILFMVLYKIKKKSANDYTT